MTGADIIYRHETLIKEIAEIEIALESIELNFTNDETLPKAAINALEERMNTLLNEKESLRKTSFSERMIG
jgi:hypothetical protein